MSRCVATSGVRLFSATTSDTETCSERKAKKAKTPIGKLDDHWEGAGEEMAPEKNLDKPGSVGDPYGPFPEARNPETGEIGGPRGPEPTRYGDWERKGRVIDF